MLLSTSSVVFASKFYSVHSVTEEPHRFLSILLLYTNNFEGKDKKYELYVFT